MALMPIVPIAGVLAVLFACYLAWDVLRRDAETGFKIVRRKIIIAQNVMLPKVVNTFF